MKSKVAVHPEIELTKLTPALESFPVRSCKFKLIKRSVLLQTRSNKKVSVNEKLKYTRFYLHS